MNHQKFLLQILLLLNSTSVPVDIQWVYLCRSPDDRTMNCILNYNLIIINSIFNSSIYHSINSPFQPVSWWSLFIESLNKTLSIPSTEVRTSISPSKLAISVFTNPGCSSMNSIFSSFKSLENDWTPNLEFR